MLTNTDFSNKVNLMLQVQVCRNITKPILPAACNVSAPAYMVCLIIYIGEEGEELCVLNR